MFVYTTTLYPSPALYSLPHYIAASPVPTAGERYLQALAEARARYLSELEEQHILAGIRQKEALHQANIRRGHIFAAHNDIYRWVGRIYAENLCRPVASQGRRRVFVRSQREIFFPTQQPQNRLNNMEALVSALLQDGGDVEYMTERENERVRVEEVRKADVLNARTRFTKMNSTLDTPQAGHNAHTARPFIQANKPSTAPTLDHVPLWYRAEIPLDRLSRERAARTIQRQWRAHSADAVARNDALTTIETLRARYIFLRDTFSFPEHLEFKHTSDDQEQEVPTLLFTQANAAVHAYTHELTKLLSLADAVPSHGSHHVREERRSFVRLVEEALDHVDRRVAKVWGKRIVGSAIMRSGPDAPEISQSVRAHVPHLTGESMAHAPEPNVSVPGKDSTTTDSEPLLSCCESDGDSNSASTIIPSHATPTTHPPTLDNTQAHEAPSRDITYQDVPPEHTVPIRIPTPSKALNIQGDVMIINSIRDNHGEAVHIQLNNIDTIVATPGELNPADPSEASQLSSVVGMVFTGVTPTSEGVDFISASPAPDITTSESVDVVYPDSPPSSPIVVDGSLDLQEPTGPSVPADEDAAARLRDAEDEAQNNLKRDVEEEGFELL